MKERFLSGWNFIRVLYLVLGLMVLVQSVIQREWAGVLFGIYFSAMGLFAFGCASGTCFGGSCSALPDKQGQAAERTGPRS